MHMPYVLLQVILTPIVGAIFSVLAGRRINKRLGWVAFAFLGYTAFLLINVGLDLWNGTSSVYEQYNWTTAVFNLKFGFLADGLSLPLALVISILCAAVAVYSLRYMEQRIGQEYGKDEKGMYSIYYSVYLLFVTGLLGIVLSTNLVELYLFVELVLIPSYFMLDLFGYVDRHRIAIMYFVWNHVGAAFFLIGVVLASAGTGSFEISALSSLSGSLGFWVCFFILIGWLVKMAVFGVHVWLPYAHGEKPTSFAAVIAPVVGAGGYVMVRLLYGQLLTSFEAFGLPLMVLSVVTIIYGAFLTMAQDDIKRLYACSTISQTAYTLLGIASMTRLGAIGGIFYFISHIIGKCILFSVAGILVTQTGLRNIKEMGGLARKMPLTATLCLVGAMILSAFPPLSGFQGEWILFGGVFQHGVNGSAVDLIVAVIGILATFLTVVYTFWPAVRMFFGEVPASLENVKEAPPSMIVPLFILAGVSFIIGVFPQLIMNFLNTF
jgi:formate hydrogenlyase subunit 3/multisubunit Na+/H+ antiporter MnhD subunit